MTDNKLTDAEIKKALECCAEQKCWECPNEPKENKKGTFGCSWEMMLATLDLINRLQAENERLNFELTKSKWAKFLGDYEQIKAEAYKEFAERCKKRASMYGFGDKSGVWVNTKDIDNLLKELVGE